jgi:hypothetical protein
MTLALSSVLVMIRRAVKDFSWFPALMIWQTDEDMFRALRFFPSGSSEAVLHPTEAPDTSTPISLVIRPEGVFATTVGASTKKTLANWHVTGPQEIIDTISFLVTQQKWARFTRRCS